jgi:hypothetical protein
MYLTTARKNYSTRSQRGKMMTTMAGSRRVVLYVRSVEMPSGGHGNILFHCEACERHHGVDVDRLKTPAHLRGRAFPDTDWQAINLAQRLQQEKQCEVEVIDLAQNFWQRIRLRRRGIGKTPQFVIDEQLLPPITSFDQLAKFFTVDIIPQKSRVRKAHQQQKRGDILPEASDQPKSGAVRH